MIQPGLTRTALKRLSDWGNSPQAYRNMLLVLVAERARRHSWPDLATDAMSRCTNPAYVELWNRWCQRFSSGVSRGRNT